MDALGPAELAKAIGAEAARYIEGIDLRFNGTRVAPSLAGVKVARSRRRGAFPADRGAIGGRRAEGREDADLHLRGKLVRAARA